MNMESQEASNFKLCIICQQKDDKNPLVLQPKPESYANLLSAIEARAHFLDTKYIEIKQRLKNLTVEGLQHVKAVWHRSCYASATNKTDMQRAKERKDYALCTGSYPSVYPGHKRKFAESECDESSAAPFRRSSTTPLNKDLCFFCQEENGQKVYMVRTENAGRTLRDAVQISKNQVLQTKLNSAISPDDAHAIDVRYHRQCWTKHVFHVTRKKNVTPGESRSADQYSMQTAALIELVQLIDIKTQNKALLAMDDIETTYINILGGDEKIKNHSPAFSRKWLKEKVLLELPHLQSVEQKNKRKCSILYCPEACEEDLVHTAIAEDSDNTDDMKMLYKVAQDMRRRIMDFDKNKEPVKVTSVTSSVSDVPTELYLLIRWMVVGTMDELQNEKRTRLVDRTALTLSQNLVYAVKSDRQVTYKPQHEGSTFRTHRIHENPQSLGLALTVHHETRSKRLIDLLSNQDYCVSFKRTLLLETSLANAVVESTRLFNGLYVPPFLKKESFIFFAVDNSDFSEDTPDGKGTTHGTITAVYQSTAATGEEVAPPLAIRDASNLTVKPHHVPLLKCAKPLPKPDKRSENMIVSTTDICKSPQNSHFEWIVAVALSKMRKESDATDIPGWAAFHSLTSQSKVRTNVGSMPLLPEVAHEWSTLLTVITQAIQLKELATGGKYLTVISFDMALYEKVIQLLDARPDLKTKVLPRLGELHVVMAALRALGTSIENSGIDDAWMEGNLYGPATVRQIIKCTHYKRSLRAHIYSYMALYELALEEFFEEHQTLKELLLREAASLEEACATESCSAKEAQQSFHNSLVTSNFITAFDAWEKGRSDNVMFKSLMNYLHRVELVLFFVAATRNASLSLHIEAGEALGKLFFSLDRIKYKRLWPRYIADMKDLKVNHPETWEQLSSGGIAVTKNDLPFVSIGADHACEHLNRAMKAQSGLKGISNNANARQRFFLAAPEMARLASHFKHQFGNEEQKKQIHHENTPSIKRKDQTAVKKIKDAILRNGNPFSYDGDRLYNLITNAFMSEESVKKILDVDERGQELYEEYVAERINGGVSLWAPVKKEKNDMYRSDNIKAKVKTRDGVVDLKETKDLYGRLMVLTRSNRDINQKEAIGHYEFTITPRALFSPDGQMLSCSDKSKLIHQVQSLVSQNENEGDDIDSDAVQTSENARHRIAVVDGMAVVQSMTKKVSTMTTVKELSLCFDEKVKGLTRDYDETIVVFDTYKHDSLKQATREKRRKGNPPVQYQVKDETNIKHISLQRFLSHESTKADLTEYLAKKLIEYHSDASKHLITSAGGHTLSSRNVEIEDNNHEEADTLMIFQAALATQRNPPDAEMVFFAADTDVLILVIAYYDLLPRKTSVSLSSGSMEIQPILQALGKGKAQALPAFHAFTGCDITGAFARKGKLTWWKLFLGADSDVLKALKSLYEPEDISRDTIKGLEKFVCSAYAPKGIQIDSIPELRWHLFCKHMAESEKLPPTLGALKEHIKRVQVQAHVWGQADVASQNFLDPQKYGYYLCNDGKLLPSTTNEPPAPKAILELVRCQCKLDCSSNRCSCKSRDLACTELCLCGPHCDNDEDKQAVLNTSDDSDESDGSDE